MADILLIYPQQLPIKLKRDLRPPLNLLYLSAVLLQKKYKVEILDLSIIDDNWQEKIKKIITKEKPLFVGITSLTNYMIRSGLDVAEYIKNNFNIPIVWGGIHARLEPETTIQNPLIDVVAYDEGEVIIEELANYFSSKSKKIEDIKGIYYKQNNKIIKNPLSNEHYNLDNLPFIPFDLININNYANKDYLFFGFKSDISFSLETSRGCKFRCGYCVETVIKNKWRGMSAERVIEHIEHINKKYNVKALVFVDDNFFVDEQRSEIILKKIIEKKFEMEYYAPIRSDLICKRGLAFLKLMEQAGFKSAGLGVESGSNRVLKYLKKVKK
ncbi:MAG TPA: cobalamin-dependent protein [bacterium]|nr:cobalamin-dependent protein [bacterium]